MPPGDCVFVAVPEIGTIIFRPGQPMVILVLIHVHGAVIFVHFLIIVVVPAVLAVGSHAQTLRPVGEKFPGSVVFIIITQTLPVCNLRREKTCFVKNQKI